MTARVAYSRRAAAEAEEIEAYLAEHSPQAAERFREALEGVERRLSEFPNSGAPGARRGTRRLIVGNYIVSYRQRADDVEIFAVRDARRRDARL
jgi:plasmid stabilization system protein ParE